MRGMVPAIVFMVAVVGMFNGSSWGAEDEMRRARPHSIHMTTDRTVSHDTSLGQTIHTEVHSTLGESRRDRVGEITSVAAVTSAGDVPLQQLGDLVSRYGNKERTGAATGAQYLHDLGTTVQRYTGNRPPPASVSLDQFSQNVTTVQQLVQPYVEKNGWGDIGAAGHSSPGISAHPNTGAIQVRPDHPSLRR